ncbi:hypothetical protein M885DRAFT_174075 [Pelagophyceae sp. CCMP2097]|nr:hypothetical protein M885DRAFT_174075 [Pelagophyceae sp. CCMP2097]
MRRRAGLARGTQAAPVETEASDSKKTLFSNFQQYGLPAPEIVRLDASRFFESWAPANEEVFDAIVTDPPYGIRAGARCTGSAAGELVKVVPEHLRADHVPATQPYPVADVIADLLTIAARTLKTGSGRLAYLLPATTDFDPANDTPRHPCLELVNACPQPISAKYARWLIVMRKVQPWAPEFASPETRAMVKASADAPWVTRPRRDVGIRSIPKGRGKASRESPEAPGAVDDEGAFCAGHRGARDRRWTEPRCRWTVERWLLNGHKMP